MVLTLVAASPATAETVLRRGHHDEAESLDPQKTDGAQEMWIEGDLFEGLVRLHSHSRIVPGLATDWTVSADGLVWVFHLRHGLTWSDGSPLTAEDFVWTLRRAVDPATASPYAQVLFPIVGAQALSDGASRDPATLGISAPDPDTLQVRLIQPTAFLPGIMALSVAMPLPRRVIEAAGTEWARPGRIVSNGAFTLEGWRPQLDITLLRNPHYWDAGSVRLDRVVWRTVEDDETSLRLYRTGELDIAMVSPKAVPRLRTEMPDQLHTDPNLRVDFLALNTRMPPLDDVRIRRALTMSIDRDVLATKVNAHGQAPATSFVPPGLAGYRQQAPDWAAWPMPERLEQARRLLADAGYGPDHTLNLVVSYPASESNRLSLSAIAAMWHRLGVETTLDQEENRVFNAALRDHQQTIGLTDWIADYADPWTFLSSLSSQATGENSSDYHNPAYDGLLDQATHTLDPAARLAILETAEAMINRDAPVVPVAWETRPVLVSPHVRGYDGNPLDYNLSRDLSLVP